MTITDINKILSQLAENPTRDNVLDFSFALLRWMNIEPNAGSKPQLLSPQTQKLKEYLATAPQTVQPQLYRLSADNQNIRVRFAVLKKLKKDYISQLVDNDPGLGSYQAMAKGLTQQAGGTVFIPTQPYFIHFVTTPDYDRLVLIFNQGEQKRIVTFRNRLTNTQYNKIILAWLGIGTKSKPEIADLLWKSLDIKEVNKEFYKQIKERFDDLVAIAKIQQPKTDEAEIKQFVVRLIGRYIFCWFLKEKEIIPEKLLASETILQTNSFDKVVLVPLFFKTLNTPVADRTPRSIGGGLGGEAIPYLNGGLFEKHPEDVLFDTLNLNDWLISFVKVLESFDFTVDESNSIYQQVAIDPEMLGRIFENLLASQNEETEKLANRRKAFGAFYTPREIVEYMVNESLKTHIETCLLPEEPQSISANAVHESAVAYKGTLFADIAPPPMQMNPQPHNPDIEKQRERLKEKIEKLFAPGCSENPFDKTETPLVRHALTDVKILDPACGSGAFPMGVLLRIMELRQIVGHGHKNNYELKNEVLSRNIYGVDIMPMAVEIARLRAWLSLVLEADYKPTDRKNNFGVAALPNLDFKFVCANSLIDSGYDEFASKLEKSYGNATLMSLDGEVQKLGRLRDDYFDPKGDKAIKEQLQAEFKKTKDYIKNEFASLRKSWNLSDFFDKVDDWNPFDDSHPSSFFSPAWMFGIKDGFDVVIGNPPYGGKLSKEDIDLFKKTYDLKTSETAILFIEKGQKILKKNGIQSYIIPKSFTFASNYNSTRDYVEKGLKIIVDCGKAFEEVKLEACIFQFKNGVELTTYNSLRFTENSTFEKLSKIDKSLKKEFGFYPNGLLANEINLGKKISEGSLFLKDICENSRGCLLQDKLKKSGNIKIIGGKEIDRYGIRGIKGYINEGDNLLKKCKIGERSLLAQNIVAHLTNPTERIKIICCLPLEKEGYAITDTINQITITNKEYFPETIWSLLSSKLINWYVYLFIYGKAIRTMHFDNVVTDRIPIHKTSIQQQQPFIERVEKILSLKKKNQDTTSLEKEIDVLVYKLYELTYDEVKIIDKDFWLSKAEYENYKTN